MVNSFMLFKTNNTQNVRDQDFWSQLHSRLFVFGFLTYSYDSLLLDGRYVLIYFLVASPFPKMRVSFSIPWKNLPITPMGEKANKKSSPIVLCRRSITVVISFPLLFFGMIVQNCLLKLR